MIFLLSPDQQFPGSGIGTISSISYSTVFHTVKRFFVVQWAHPRVQAITKKINDYVFMGVDETAHDLSTNADDAAGKEDFTDSLNLVMASLDDEDSDDDEAVRASVSSPACTVHGTPPSPPLAPTTPTPAAPVLPVAPTLTAMSTTRTPTPGLVMITDSQSMPTPVSIPRSPPAITIPAATARDTHVEVEGGGLVETGIRKKGKKKGKVAEAPIRRSSRNVNA